MLNKIEKVYSEKTDDCYLYSKKVTNEEYKKAAEQGYYFLFIEQELVFESHFYIQGMNAEEILKSALRFDHDISVAQLFIPALSCFICGSSLANMDNLVRHYRKHPLIGSREGMRNKHIEVYFRGISCFEISVVPCIFILDKYSILWDPVKHLSNICYDK